MLRLNQLRGQRSQVSDLEATASANRAAARRDALAFAGAQTAVGRVSELEVDGGAGPLAARHFVPPQSGDSEPLLVFAHGGGWTLGDLDTHDEPCRLLCRHAGIHVLSIDYRLAPEHPFPAALDDVMAAWRWARAHTAQLGADASRVAIGGDSGGGTFSAVTARLLARAGGPVPALQVLIYPATDLAERRRSSELFGEGFLLTKADRDWFDENYLAGTGVDREDARVSPLRAADLSGLPPAIVVTAGFDLLRDEGEAYGAALRAAGNQVTTYRASSLIHGFINMTAVNRACREATIKIAGMIRTALTTPR
jgi:acetyl esterase